MQLLASVGLPAKLEVGFELAGQSAMAELDIGPLAC